MKLKSIKSISTLAAVFLLTGSLITGCSSSGGDSGSSDGKKEEVVLTLNDNSKVANEYAITNDIVAKYKEVAPHVTIELESPKDGTDQENQLKIRKTANELPDIMIVNKKLMTDLKDSLLPLDDLEAAKNNELLDNGTLDGTLYGLCTGYNLDFAFYKKSVFEELKLEIPQTWDEFVKVSEAIKADGKYTPILMGAKDPWVTFPLYEAMPFIEANDGDVYSKMAATDEPFASGQPFYDAVEKIQKLNDAKVYGSDPVGLGFDQVKAMFGTKGAMLLSSQWFLGDAEKANNGDLSDVGVFLIPYRNEASDDFNVLAHPSSNICINKDSQNAEEAKKFVDWYLSEEWLPGQLEAITAFSPIKGQEVNLHAMITEAMEAQPNRKLITQNIGGNEDFIKIKNEIKFDVDSLGQEIIAGKDYKTSMNDLNKAWKDARAKLGIK
ncbi:MAG: ABC transporter substrate-binding protein [Peptostreptococcaceae bacterium]